jgi:hypothetical protein
MAAVSIMSGIHRSAVSLYRPGVLSSPISCESAKLTGNGEGNMKF